QRLFAVPPGQRRQRRGSGAGRVQPAVPVPDRRRLRRRLVADHRRRLAQRARRADDADAPGNRAHRHRRPAADTRRRKRHRPAEPRPMNKAIKLPGRQQGASLVVVLILLLVMTLLGLAVLRGTLLEERMSANMYDRSLAFQQAESALREAEEKVRNAVLANGNGWVIGVKCGADPSNGGAGGIDATKCGAMPANIYGGGTVCAGASLTGDCWFNATDQLGTDNNSAGTPQYYV